MALQYKGVYCYLSFFFQWCQFRPHLAISFSMCGSLEGRLASAAALRRCCSILLSAVCCGCLLSSLCH
jgi:hypothetical protein